MKSVLAGIGLFVGALVLVLGLTWVAEGNDFFLYKTFAPKMEAVRAQTFEQSHAYNEGVAQDISRAQEEYTLASPNQSAAIRSLILQRYANYDDRRLPQNLQQFLNYLREGTR